MPLAASRDLGTSEGSRPFTRLYKYAGIAVALGTQEIPSCCPGYFQVFAFHLPSQFLPFVLFASVSAVKNLPSDINVVALAAHSQVRPVCLAVVARAAIQYM